MEPRSAKVLEKLLLAQLQSVNRIRQAIRVFDVADSSIAALKAYKEIIAGHGHRHAALVVESWSSDDPNDEQLLDIEAEFRNAFTTAMGELEDKIVAVSPPIIGPIAGDANAIISAPPIQRPKVKFPTIALPEFDGSLDKWLMFRDTFEALIHSSTTLSNIEKFHYLVGSLKLPPGQYSVLSGFTPSEASYEGAWAAVKDRYDDKRKLKSQQFCNMLSVKKMASETPGELRRVLDAYSSSVTTLFQLKASLDDIIVHIVQQRLDDQTQRDWQKHIGEADHNWEDLRQFLKSQWRTLDQLPAPRKVVETKPPYSSPRTFAAADVSSGPCWLCNSEHRIFNCEQFLALTPRERTQVANAKRVCRNCLSPAHALQHCPSKNRCKKCNYDHHSMLHWERNSSQVPPSTFVAPAQVGAQCEANRPSAPSLELFRSFAEIDEQRASCSNSAQVSMTAQAYIVEPQSLLSTLNVRVRGANGSCHVLRALWDSGSTDHYITEKAASQLGLNLRKASIPVTGFGDKTTYIKNTTSARISSLYGPFEYDIATMSVTPVITGNIPSRFVNRQQLTIPVKHQLADPDFHRPRPVDLLIGNSITLAAELPEKIQLPEGPYLKHTKFGWIIGGDIVGYAISEAPQPSLLTCFAFSMHGQTEAESELADKIEKFMAIENLEGPVKRFTPTEQYCEELFRSTTQRDASGRFIVQLPFKKSVYQLGQNINNAYRQFRYQESRREKDPELKALYVDYMKNYEASGDMQEVSSTQQYQGTFLEHHGVKKISSTTTKLRPVFNGSRKTETGESLNDCLCVGPTIQPDLFDILVRFRERRYVIKADIEKMYRQVLVEPDHRKFLKILWRSDPSQPIKTYELSTVTFGLAPSAWLAIRSLVQAALDYADQFPRAAAVIQDSFYIDDLMFSVDELDDGRELIRQIRLILSAGGFPLRKISSNNPSMTQGLPTGDVEMVTNDSESIKALGHNWFPRQDKMTISLPAFKSVQATKSSVLSDIASIFDPLGIIGPVTLLAKLFMKELWKLEIDWKSKLPAKLSAQWDEFRSQFSALNDVFFDRFAGGSAPAKVDFHGFSDSSEKAYGAAIYIRVIDAEGKIHVSLICSKSRVSPPKKPTLARLELCAALLLAKLMVKVRAASTLSGNVTLWSDSMIVLHWINTHPSRLATFVANRVTLIQELTAHFTWRHIRTECNPADIISRGLLPKEIRDCVLWWQGPSFFRLPSEQWPQSLITIDEDEPSYANEIRRTLTIVRVSSLFAWIETRFSRYNILVNASAWIFRFINNHKKQAVKRSGALTVDEREQALMKIIAIIQQAMFPHEYRYLLRIAANPASDEPFPSQSTILALAPFLDIDNMVIRVGGRLDASAGLTFQQKHPIILPECQFAVVVVRHLHRLHLHPGARAMLSIVREEFWPLKAKSIIRKVIHQCMTCFKVKPRLATQFMGSLPAARVTMSPPFSSTAVDYAGAFGLRSSMTFKARIVKAYVAVFKCMSTGAIHLEAVSSLSTAAFVAAFDRFVSRRGLSHDMYSDNGTNFHGTDNEFRGIIGKIEKGIAAHLSSKAVRWHFSCPLAPHAGGYYESAVKMMKHHLVRTADTHSFDFEQFQTVLCKIEAILNSRPLTPLSEDPSDCSYLSPGHFLIGRPLIAKPELDLINAPKSRIDRWNGLQQIQQQFWHAWYHDYLHQLQTRPIGFQSRSKFAIGDMVLIKDPNLPPLKWLVGRICDVFPDKANVVRNVQVRTVQNGKEHFYQRHVRYLCLLPMEASIVGVGQSVALATL